MSRGAGGAAWPAARLRPFDGRHCPGIPGGPANSFGRWRAISRDDADAQRVPTRQTCGGPAARLGYDGRRRAARRRPDRIVTFGRMLDFRQIETFLCVFEEGNVTRAAAKLNIVQPAVSAQIKKLEVALKLELFERSPRGISPTAAGRALYRIFAPVLESFRTAEHRAHALSAVELQEIMIGMNPFAGNAIMGDVLQTYRLRHPDVGVHVEEDTSPTLLRRIADGALDLAIVHFSPHSPGIPATVVATPLAEEELVLIERSTEGNAGEAPLRFTELAGRSLVLPKWQLGFRRDVDHAARESGTLIRIELEINAPAPIIDLVAHGDLAAIVPEITARRALQNFPLRMRRIVRPTLLRSILYVKRRDRPLSPQLDAFVGVVKATIEDALGRGGGEARATVSTAPRLRDNH
jgi:DNA-binding transcriptional LysR family regulator